MRYVAILLVALLGGPAVAQIKAPDKVPTGQLVVLETQPQDGVSVGWMVAEPLDLVYRTFENGNAISFASGCAPHRIVLIVTSVNWSEKTIKQDRVIVEVVGPQPPGPDPPGPDPPGPDPPNPPGPIPDDEFGNVGQQAYKWAMAFDAAAKAAAPKVAANYLLVSQGLDNGQLPTIELGYAKLVELNGGVLTQPGVRQQYVAWQEQINAVWNQHQPMTKWKIARFFAAMHAALSQVK